MVSIKSGARLPEPETDPMATPTPPRRRRKDVNFMEAAHHAFLLMFAKTPRLRRRVMLGPTSVYMFRQRLPDEYKCSCTSGRQRLDGPAKHRTANKQTKPSA